MIANSLSHLYEQISSTRMFRIGTTDVTNSKLSHDDYLTIVNGLVLWIGILLDYNSILGESDLPDLAHRAKSRIGRIIRFCTDGWLSQQVHLLGELLTALDDLTDIQLVCMSDPATFKGCGRADFSARISQWNTRVCPTPYVKGLASVTDPSNKKLLRWVTETLIDFADTAVDDGEAVQLFTVSRQILCFLRKLEVNRPDLLERALIDFYDKEIDMRTQHHDKERTEDYINDVRGMRMILKDHPIPLDWTKFVPGHGNGAVASPSVKSWLDKYLTMDTDLRIEYLLHHTGLGTGADYNPFAKDNTRSTRTSRFIAVPKTWKKLRGISAEPTELQFWQHGLSAVVDRGLRRDIFWRNRIDLHDQTKSQKLALSGSVSGEFATIDLSAASDSVSLRLVRDLFGNSELGRWLLGTRSVFTEYAPGVTLRLSKFAPMGSNLCFPVQCIVFALAAELAVNRTIAASYKRKTVQVYGDDIVVPSYAVDELYSILDNLGFTVNYEKSFSTGSFRESCGTEAWKGVDIAPLRYKSVPFVSGAAPITSEILASCIGLANGLFMRGLHGTRQYFLQTLLRKHIRINYGPKGHKHCVRFPVQMAFFTTFLGVNSTLASPAPTNFHIKRKYSRNIQTIVYDVIRWKVGSRAKHSEEELLSCFDACRLVEWLIRHRPLSEDEADAPLSITCTSSPEIRLLQYIGISPHQLDMAVLIEELLVSSDEQLSDILISEAKRATLHWLQSFVPEYQDRLKGALDPYARLPIGSTLIPYRKWVDASYLIANSI